MAMRQDKIIINCAITGSIHIPTQSDYLPITPKQIASEAVRAAEAGAGTVHLHVRDPKTGKPNSDIGLFREIGAKIHKRSTVVQCLTTGGPMGASPEERVKVVSELEPELASMNMGSFNFALFHLSDRFPKFKHDWERPYLEMTKDYIFKNTFESMEIFLKTMRDHGTKPELECYDVGQLYNAAFMADKGYLDTPLYLQMIFGILGAIQPSVENLVHMKNTADKLFGNDYCWSALPVGRHQFSLGAVAAVMGGNVRVGLEDNLYLRKGTLLASNEEAVSKIRTLLDELSIEIADHSETRQLLKLKGKENTNFI
ncbi:MAG: 3-keto-5-aminohexanoate cleavage protein [Methanosarcinaceae archaeon]|nr:3-keto-5-aminohexanoate cleavage protein [Methanosarcinaceae archaeon]